MKLIQVINARVVLDGLSDREDVGTHLAYWMMKFVVKTQEDYEFYVREMRKVYDKYAEKQEDGTLFVSNAFFDEFNKAVSALNDTDVEDPGIRFKLSELATDFKLSMKQIYPLLDFIDEGQ